MIPDDPNMRTGENKEAVSRHQQSESLIGRLMSLRQSVTLYVRTYS